MKEKILSLFYIFARMMPAIVLFYAGYVKIAAPMEEFAYAIERYRILPSLFIAPITQFFPWFEVYLAVLLFFGLFQNAMLKTATMIFLVFEILLLQALLRGLEVTNCGCFGASKSNSIGLEFTMNIVWLALLILASIKKPNFSLDSFLERRFSNEN